MRTFLGKLWARWKRFGLLLGNAVGRVVLSVLYFTVFAPFAVVARLQDPLRLKQSAGDTFWVERKPTPTGMDEGQRMG